MSRLTLAEIERRLLIAGDAPGLRLKSTLMRGQTDGGTRLVLEGTHRLLSGSIGVDNRLDKTLGRWQLNGNLALNSPFGFGEQFYGAFGSGTDFGPAFGTDARLRLFGGGAVIPLGSDGWTINPEYTQSQTQPTPLPGAPATRGTFAFAGLEPGRFAGGDPAAHRGPGLRRRSEPGPLCGVAGRGDLWNGAALGHDDPGERDLFARARRTRPR